MSPINLQDKEARQTIDALDDVAEEMRAEYVAAVRREAGVA